MDECFDSIWKHVFNDTSENEVKRRFENQDIYLELITELQKMKVEFGGEAGVNQEFHRIKNDLNKRIFPKQDI